MAINDNKKKTQSKLKITLLRKLDWGTFQFEDFLFFIALLRIKNKKGGVTLHFHLYYDMQFLVQKVSILSGVYHDLWSVGAGASCSNFLFVALLLHCTLHTESFTLHTALYTAMYPEHCTLHPTHFTVHIEPCALHTAHCKLYTAHLTLHFAQYTQYT